MSPVAVPRCHRTILRCAALLTLLAGLPILSGCDSIGYYSQAISGQLSMVRLQQPIADLEKNPATSERLRSQLRLVEELKGFAGTHLHLPIGEQYSEYIDLDRDTQHGRDQNYVVWNVFVAPELSLSPETWCYPIAGCSAYRGYFKEAQARDFAERMEGQGFDVYVGGVAAYSTLGWFDDPVLSTWVYREEVQLAELLFHELAHQLLYVPGDTAFNESFATTVAREGVRRWLEDRGAEDLYPEFVQQSKQREEFVALVSRYRTSLGEVYAADHSPSEKRSRKELLIENMRGEYESRGVAKGQAGPYSGWLKAPVNNAKLNSVGLYNDLVPGLTALLADEQGDLPRFYQRCVTLADLPLEARRSQLK
jgi:predicted aminopeptidase